MTTYRTGNPIGSTDPRDLYDNAENLDEAVNTRTAESWDDRFGVARKTWWGMEQDFQQFLLDSGYVNIGDYGPGLEITERNQIFWRDGELYRAGASLELPYTTTGDWGAEEGLFVAAGDQVLRQELTDTKGAYIVKNGVVAVDNIADLLALPAEARREDLRYLVKSFYPNNEVGGAEFYWDADLSKTEHTGGTVIDPDKADDLDALGLSGSYFTPAGSGIGCFVVRAGTYIDSSNFGVIPGDSSTMIGLQAMLDAGIAQINLEHNKEYICSDSELVSRGKDLELNFNGSSLIQNNPNTSAISISGGYEILQDVSAINVSGGIVGLSVASTTGYERGDIFKIVDEQTSPYFITKQGEFAVVEDVDSANNIIKTRSPFYFNYSTAQQCRIGKLHQAKIVLNQPKVIGPSATDAGTAFSARHLIVIEAALRPVVNDLYAENIYESAINFRSCYEYTCNSPAIKHAANRDSSYYSGSEYTGYLVRDTACENSTIIDPKITHCRHGIVYIGPDGGYFDSGLTNYGESAYNKTIGGIGSGCSNAPFDFHHGSRFNKFINPVARRNDVAIQFRGVGNKVLDGEFFENSVDWTAFVQSNYSLGQASTVNCSISYSTTNPLNKGFEVRPGVEGMLVDLQMKVSGVSSITNICQFYNDGTTTFRRASFDFSELTSITASRLMERTSGNPKLICDFIEASGDMSNFLSVFSAGFDTANSRIKSVSLYNASDFPLIGGTTNANAMWPNGYIAGPYLGFADKTSRVGW